MSKKALDIGSKFNQDSLAEYIAYTWNQYNMQRKPKIDAWKEARNYVFATDTRTTSNNKLPWKNSTTIPKLCQIRDNLHSNYISALFPNDDWLQWEAYSDTDATKKKRKAIQAYMSNKARQGGLRMTVSDLLYDFIDYGNAFATVDFEASYKVDAIGRKVPDYVGPKARRISPLDIVFNPLASSFRDSFKIIRSLKNISELALMAQEQPDNAYLANALKNRKELLSHMSTYGIEEMERADAFLVDGFGNYSEYLGGQYVEFLEFYGDIYDSKTGVLEKNQYVAVIDRMWVVIKRDIPSWMGHAPIYHTGWRKRPDNLWAMGPLENLVGMQYRIDHLENLKADAMDLAVLPPLVIKGDVEAFEYKPGAEIHMDENGDVEELARNAQWVIQCDNAIAILEQKMEQYAGAPREAMGIRSPGEKTMFEVAQLQNAAGRIFQEKTSTFEMELFENLLNAMLETSRRNMDAGDVVRIIDDDLGVEDFMSVTKEDITATGNLRPIGARHFAAQAQLVQNLTGLANTPIWQQISPHVSTKKLSLMVEDILGLERYGLIKPNAGVYEQQELARLANQASENLEVEQSLGTDPEAFL